MGKFIIGVFAGIALCFLVLIVVAVCKAAAEEDERHDK